MCLAFDWGNYSVWKCAHWPLQGWEHLEGYVVELRADHHPSAAGSSLWVDGFIVSTLGVVYYDLFCFNKIHKQNYFKAFCYYFLHGTISRKPHRLFWSKPEPFSGLMLCSSWHCRLHTVIWNIMVVFRKVSPILCCDLLISLRPKEEKITLTSWLNLKRK